MELTNRAEKLFESKKFKTKARLAKTDLYNDIVRSLCCSLYHRPNSSRSLAPLAQANHETLRATMSRYGIMAEIERLANAMDPASLPDSTEQVSSFSSRVCAWKRH